MSPYLLSLFVIYKDPQLDSQMQFQGYFLTSCGLRFPVEQ